jgi:hypothetical protein
MPRRRELAHGGELLVPITTEGQWCPVCGINLSPSDLEAPDEDYFCPYCTTRKKPRAFDLRVASA